ncbi:C4-dicarboxylate ABC transporter permease [Nitrincola sp. A-D6]|uniref:TRAP transporter small permease subunit n=1 Tax=Nitrincola sp. A-D6 TaxID=1545442 RepID=UPI00051FAC8F|nr:TRAP transporter small permease subunit [Nitrincola sp. A-D6]KGK42986.1 C4-dicarboxylate ABC transporter permease [Nitrincola sp. A-D6]
MKMLSLLIRLICRINLILGHVFSWFSLGIVLVCFTVVVMRYFFSSGSVWMQDLYVWLNGMMFMGIAGFTLLQNGHVRVDIFYRPAGIRRKALVDMIGAIVFIAPFLYIISVYSFPYVQRSWRFMEGSANFGGMQGLYVVKSFILVFVAVVALQALAMVMRSILILSNNEALVPESYRYKEGG